MAYRNILISNHCSLRLKNKQLVIDNGEVFSFPIEDIRSVLIDNDSSVLSAKLISFLAESGVCLIICDGKHMPSACLMSISVYCRQNRRIILQFEQSKPKLKGIWQDLVIKKISNQAKCLKLNGKDNKLLSEIAKSVNSGDTTNREGYAARIYFRQLFGENFIRNDDDVINAALNYGYAILRSFIAKTIVAYGFEASIGIHHKNQLNQFNLADDIIEPYRPIIDNYVYQNHLQWDNDFSTKQKGELLLLLNSAVVMDGKRFSVANAIELTVQSLASSFENEKSNLKLPDLIDIDFFDYE